ncbi:MAG: sulfotransferase family protein [Pseudoalteromonas sp.]
MEKSTIHFAAELATALAKIDHALIQNDSQQPELQLADTRQRIAQNLKLIIHAGTPKTGTTSLQTYLDKKQRKLRGKGILYPHNLEKLKNPHAPKHQWFEKNLVTTNLDSFLENVKNILSQVTSDTHTIILSSEGIYNYWWDFPDASKDVLSELSKLFDIELWVWFRDPIEFIESYYKQCIRNPQLDGNPCYGKNLSFADMLKIDWFARHLDYQGFVDECQMLFGENKVSVFNYEGDVVQEVIQKLGLATAHDNPTSRQNKSLNSASVKLLRTINNYNLKAKDKERLMPHLKEINTLLENYTKDALIDAESRRRVLALARPIKF